MFTKSSFIILYFQVLIVFANLVSIKLLHPLMVLLTHLIYSIPWSILFPTLFIHILLEIGMVPWSNQ